MKNITNEEEKYWKIDKLFKDNGLESGEDIQQKDYNERSFIEAIWDIILE